ncbi:MAG: amphi-Trp domain-containing protein [Candidatus Natronoplasma sp.]
MPEIPNKGEGKKRVITEGDMEHEVYLDREQIADFLEGLAKQLREGDKVTIKTEEWELPFTFRDPIELEIDYEGYGEKELEIEIEMKEKKEEEAPTVS